jgi:hypothetical protein
MFLGENLLHWGKISYILGQIFPLSADFFYTFEKNIHLVDKFFQVGSILHFGGKFFHFEDFTPKSGKICPNEANTSKKINKNLMR